MNFDVGRYWNRRYSDGRTSGAGSEGDAAVAKGEFLNTFIHEHDISSVVDWGVGDGVVFSHMTCDVAYMGIDISTKIIERLRRKYADTQSATFLNLQQARIIRPRADLAISSDVIFHQIDDADYYAHLKDVFTSATSFVVIHSTNHDGGRDAPHVLWRKFTPDVEAMFPQWVLHQTARNVIGWYSYEKA